MDAYNTVLPNASFEEPDNKQTLLNESASALDAAGLSKCSVDDLYFAYDESGKKIGCVMSATSPSGYPRHKSYKQKRNAVFKHL